MKDKKKFIEDVLQWQHYLWQIALLYWDNVTKWEELKDGIGLELGAREGGLSLWLAKKKIHVVCSDIQPSFDKARLLHSKYNVQNQIQYEVIDATQIPYENYFDIIVLKSVLGGIGANHQVDKQVKTIEEIHRALKPGGYFLFVENAQGTMMHQMLRKFRPWSVYWNYPTYSFFQKCLSKYFSYYDIQGFGFLGVCAPIPFFQRVLLPVDKFLSKFIPNNMQAILYGIARK